MLPHPSGWAAITYGDPIVPEGEIVPLPFGLAAPYDYVIAGVEASPIGKSAAFVDGWRSIHELAELEPELFAKAWIN